MRARIALRTVLLLLPIVLSSCQLLGGSTQVRFLNSASFTLASVQFGSLTLGSPLAPGPATGYSPVPPGQAVLTAESQTGSWSNGVLLSIVAGHSYTIGFSGASFSAMTVTLTADN
jgi:hypothetical protein